MAKQQMTPADARRIQSAGDRKPQSKTSKTDFGRRAQAATTKPNDSAKK